MQKQMVACCISNEKYVSLFLSRINKNTGPRIRVIGVKRPFSQYFRYFILIFLMEKTGVPGIIH